MKISEMVEEKDKLKNEGLAVSEKWESDDIVIKEVKARCPFCGLENYLSFSVNQQDCFCSHFQYYCNGRFVFDDWYDRYDRMED